MQKRKKEPLIETFGELAAHLGCSTRWARVLWKKYAIILKYRFGPRGRFRMTIAELKQFKRKLYAKGADDYLSQIDDNPWRIQHGE